MTLHTRIFGVKLGLILWCAIVAICLGFQMWEESYIGVVVFFAAAGINDFIKWMERR